MKNTRTPRATENPQTADLATTFATLNNIFLDDLLLQLEKADLSLPQFLLLATLVEKPAMEMSAVSVLMQHTNAAATGMVDRLKNLGYLDRARSTEDRRVVNVFATKKGISLVKKIQHALFGDLLSELSASEKASLIKGTKQVSGRLHEVNAGQ